MRVDMLNLATILAMAAVTYATRVTGFLIAHRLSLTGRAKAAFDAIPAAVLTAVIAPSVLASSWQESVAAVLAMIAATRLPLLGTVAVGVLAVVGLRWIG